MRTSDIIKDIEKAMLESARMDGPSPDIQVHCDIHTYAVMNRACTSTLHEFLLDSQGGDYRADVNRLEHWCCAQTDCTRCYHPLYYGYFNLARTPGSTIKSSDQRQQRCTKHEWTPYFYLGSVKRELVYLCPFNGCSSRGQSLGRAAVHDQPAAALPLPAHQSKTDKQRQEELTVFCQFTKAANLGVSFFESRNPPEPDIQCQIEGTLRWFELAELVDPSVARLRNPRSAQIAAGTTFSQKHPITRILEKKRRKAYKPSGARIDLLLYSDLYLGTALTIGQIIDMYEDLLGEFPRSSPFSQVWIFDLHTNSILWPKEISLGGR